MIALVVEIVECFDFAGLVRARYNDVVDIVDAAILCVKALEESGAGINNDTFAFPVEVITGRVFFPADPIVSGNPECTMICPCIQ